MSNSDSWQKLIGYLLLIISASVLVTLAIIFAIWPHLFLSFLGLFIVIVILLTLAGALGIIFLTLYYKDHWY